MPSCRCSSRVTASRAAVLVVHTVAAMPTLPPSWVRVVNHQETTTNLFSEESNGFLSSIVSWQLKFPPLNWILTKVWFKLRLEKGSQSCPCCTCLDSEGLIKSQAMASDYEFSLPQTLALPHRHRHAYTMPREVYRPYGELEEVAMTPSCYTSSLADHCRKLPPWLKLWGVVPLSRARLWLPLLLRTTVVRSPVTAALFCVRKTMLSCSIAHSMSALVRCAHGTIGNCLRCRLPKEIDSQLNHLDLSGPD
jgi:hypothetical protein